MTSWRRRLANVVIGAVLLGQAVDIAFDRDDWPFSSYGMYASVARSKGVTAYRLVGLSLDDGQEVALQDNAYLHPFDQSRLPSAIEDLWSGASTRDLVETALGDVLFRYESRRQSGEHDGPILGRLRLYRDFHELDPWARNRNVPNQRELLAEVEAPTQQGVGASRPNERVE